MYLSRRAIGVGHVILDSIVIAAVGSVLIYRGPTDFMLIGAAIIVIATPPILVMTFKNGFSENSGACIAMFFSTLVLITAWVLSALFFVVMALMLFAFWGGGRLVG